MTHCFLFRLFCENVASWILLSFFYRIEGRLVLWSMKWLTQPSGKTNEFFFTKIWSILLKLHRVEWNSLERRSEVANRSDCNKEVFWDLLLLQNAFISFRIQIVHIIYLLLKLKVNITFLMSEMLHLSYIRLIFHLMLFIFDRNHFDFANIGFSHDSTLVIMIIILWILIPSSWLITNGIEFVMRISIHIVQYYVSHKSRNAVTLLAASENEHREKKFNTWLRSESCTTHNMNQNYFTNVQRVHIFTCNHSFSTESETLTESLMFEHLRTFSESPHEEILWIEKKSMVYHRNISGQNIIRMQNSLLRMTLIMT